MGATTTRPPSRSSPPPAPTRSSTARSTTPATSRPSRRSRSRSRPRTTITSPRSRPGRWTRARPARAARTPSPVTVKFSATDPAPGGTAPANFNVNAAGTAWDPSTLNLTNGDRVTWNFPADDHFPHDVWVIAPGGNPAPGSPDRVQVSPIVNPGSPSVSRTFTTNGAWTFYCSLHASLRGRRVGRHGRHDQRRPRRRRPDAPTGVDYTEYRVKTGATQGDWVRTANTGGASPFASQVTVSAEGQHTVEYRSVDKAGNVEAAKTRRVRHRHPGPGLPGHPGLRRPDGRHRAAAGPLLRHRVRSRRRAADLQVGVRQRRLLRPRRRAHVHPAGDVHRQGDGDRRRGRQDLAGGHGHGPRPGRRAADGRGLGRASRRCRRARASPSRAHGHRSGRPGEQPALHVGLR